VKTREIRIESRGRGVRDLTADCEAFAAEASKGGDGVLHVFVPHATAGLVAMELGPGTEEDLMAALDRLLQRDDRWVHRHGSLGHGADHVLPLLVATDGAIAALGVDGRRLRPNIVIAGVEGLAERDWPGRRLRIRDVVVELVKLRGRCVMTTYDPDTQVQDVAVLRRIARDFGGRMALDSSVIQGGIVAVGDTVTLVG